MEIHKVYSISAELDDCLLFDMEYAEGEDSVRAIVAYRASDPYGTMSPIITQWLSDNPDQEILPYTPPPELTPEELRELMPELSSRQFWLAAYSVGVTKDDVIALCDGEQTLLIVVKESSVFVRSNPDIILLSEMMNITPEELDSLWLWAAGV